jgi:hypothetical protein
LQTIRAIKYAEELVLRRSSASSDARHWQARPEEHPARVRRKVDDKHDDDDMLAEGEVAGAAARDRGDEDPNTSSRARDSRQLARAPRTDSCTSST